MLYNNFFFCVDKSIMHLNSRTICILKTTHTGVMFSLKRAFDKVLFSYDLLKGGYEQLFLGTHKFLKYFEKCFSSILIDLNNCFYVEKFFCYINLEGLMKTWLVITRKFLES